MTAARTVVGGARFLDVGQALVESDPVAVAERIYDFAGLVLTDEVREGMAAWAEGNRRGSRGEHHYRAEEFGLTPDRIREAFADYLQVYGSYCLA